MFNKQNAILLKHPNIKFYYREHLLSTYWVPGYHTDMTKAVKYCVLYFWHYAKNVSLLGCHVPNSKLKSERLSICQPVPNKHSTHGLIRCIFRNNCMK